MLSSDPVLAVLLGILCLHCVLGQQSRICASMRYRSLPARLQNVHQCLVLEDLREELDQEEQAQSEKFDHMYMMISSLQETMKRGFMSISRTSRREEAKSTPALSDIPIVRDCLELQQTGITLSGVYPIRLPTRRLVNVYCDMDTSNGGWMVIQRRFDGSVNFTRRWNDYTFGFGNVNTEYWLGNELVHRITKLLKYSIRIDLWDWDDNHAYALYDNFHLDSEYTLYQLHIQNYSGTAGDAMGHYHDGMRFSTIDSDNDQWHSSCAKMDQSGWWFNACGFASLNGLYIENGTAEMSADGLIKGIIWYDWKNDSTYSLKRTEMKIKPLTSILYEREQAQLAEIPSTTSTTTITTSSTEPVTLNNTETSTPENPESDADDDKSEEENNFTQSSRKKLDKKFERFKILEKKEENAETTTDNESAMQVSLTTTESMTTEGLPSKTDAPISPSTPAAMTTLVNDEN